MNKSLKIVAILAFSAASALVIHWVNPAATAMIFMVVFFGALSIFQMLAETIQENDSTGDELRI